MSIESTRIEFLIHKIICRLFVSVNMVESVLSRCTNEILTQLQHKLRETENPDATTVFKQLVFSLCLTIVAGGKLERVKTKLRLPHFSTLYKNCKLCRLALIICEATRLFAHNHEVFTTGDKEDTLMFYHHPSLSRTLLLALHYRICHRKASIQFTSFLDSNQETGCFLSLFISQLTHLKKYFRWNLGSVCSYYRTTCSIISN